MNQKQKTSGVASKQAAMPKSYELLLQRLSEKARLPKDDAAVFARNLGELAAKISPARPQEGRNKILEKSGLVGTPLDQPRRYFQLPGAPEPKVLASDARVFLQLAEAAGSLLCKVDRPAAYEQAKREAVEKLVLGSRFRPTDAPLNLQDRNVATLMREYRDRLCEAIKNRTRILELWDALEATPIEIETLYPEEDVQAAVSPYGLAADVPEAIAAAFLGSSDRQARFAPDYYAAYGNSRMAEPGIEIGRIGLTHEVWLLSIPEDKRRLFLLPPDPYNYAGLLAPALDQLNAWFDEIGFELGGRMSTPFDRISGSGWKRFPVTFIHGVEITVKKSLDGAVDLGLRIRRIDPGDLGTRTLFRVSPSLGFAGLAGSHFLNEVKIQFLYDQCNVDQPDAQGNYNFDEPEFDNTVTFLFDLPHNEADEGPYAFVPANWQDQASFWIHEDDFDEFEEFSDLSVGFDDPRGQRLLLGANHIAFEPTVPAAEPIGSAARVGSIAASLLSNLSNASDEDLITKRLIDLTALTAESGLKFIAAMVEKHRRDLDRI